MSKVTQIGDTVYLKTGDDTEPKLVVGILNRKDTLTYELRSGSSEPTWHFDFEFCYEKPSKRFKVGGLK